MTNRQRPVKKNPVEIRKRNRLWEFFSSYTVFSTGKMRVKQKVQRPLGGVLTTPPPTSRLEVSWQLQVGGNKVYRRQYMKHIYCVAQKNTSI